MNRLRFRQLSSSVTILAFLMAIVGFPLPQSGPIGDEDFPCRDHGCGCTTALMCKTACCCAKPSVTPERTKPAGGCCSAQKPNAKKESTNGGWVIGSQACRGLSATWSGLGLVVSLGNESAELNLTKHVVRQIPTDHFLIPLATLGYEPPPPRPQFS